MVKVVRQAKTNIDNNISHEAIALSFVDEAPVLDVAPKQTITIKYSAEGKPTPATINAGNLGDHRATWLEFDLSELHWGMSKQDINEWYNRYIFKLAIREDENVEIWEFNGKTLELTSDLTSCEMILVIEENQDDNYEGNIDDTVDIERFVADAFKVKFTDVGWEEPTTIQEPELETDQLRSLVKPVITAKLTDLGELTTSSSVLGSKYDSSIRFIAINKKELSSHLWDFDLFIQWRLQDRTITVPLELASENEDYPEIKNLDEEYWISWVPNEVNDNPGTYNMLIYGQLGNTDDEETYYRIVSNKVALKVENNFLIDNSFVPTKFIGNSNFVDADDSIILTKDRQIWNTK